MRMKSQKLTNTHLKQTNQDEAEPTAGADDPHEEVVEAQEEVVAVATAEGSITITITMVIEDTARRPHLNRSQENPSNLLQAVTGKTETKELALKTGWATLYVT